MARKRGSTKRKTSSRAKQVYVPRFSPYAFGHAFGIVSVIAMLFYAVMIWFGNYDSSVIIGQFPLGFSFNDWTLIIGLIQTYVLSYIGGWIFARVYNHVL